MNGSEVKLSFLNFVDISNIILFLITGTVDDDMLKANVTSLGSLIDKKIELGSISQEANLEKEDTSKG